ncbi:Fe-S protein [Mannheimia granulomatis]|uniref:Fe-S protein n=1 Tax=Mannheimia granulomatis TaxID=85402 RepID=A0A6G8JH58_9PAST|nr:MOSC N-terminal beta barrel domain-containing protein [Mannheimia granulomatis]QIM66416.1 Fe-S protein [Mannheimia granulomatis]
MKVTELNIYPIKSTKGTSVSQAFVEPKGLNFDREFMITEPDGKFITARKDKELYRLTALPIASGLVITHVSGEKCVALYQDFVEEQSSEVWGTHFASKVAADSVNAWLSKIFDRAVQLRWLGAKSQREVNRFPGNPLSFADSNPVTLMSEKSLEQVQQWSPIKLEMARFRPNIVIDGNVAFEEEQWEQIQIGEVLFTKSELCTRCVLITRDLTTLELDPQAEPFRTLKQKHTNEQGKPIFGIHLVPQNSGVIRVGDAISVKV